MPKKKTTKKKSSGKRKPIGFVKQGKSFKLVFGSKTKPRLGSKTYKNRKSLVSAAKKYF